jgi:ribosomal protein S27E
MKPNTTNMKVTCPKCGSDQITSSKKGFSGKKAVAGAVLTGGIGILAGTLGSNKIKCTCLACGNTFAAGQGKVVYEPGETPIARHGRKELTEKEKKRANKILLIMGVVILIIVIAANI